MHIVWIVLELLVSYFGLTLEVPVYCHPIRLKSSFPTSRESLDGMSIVRNVKIHENGNTCSGTKSRYFHGFEQLFII